MVENSIQPSARAFDQIQALVTKYKNLPSARRKSYNEAETRKDFILPLFRALEWNIEDSNEVSAEEKISRGFVDFSFRLNGVRRFVLETKALRENLDEQRWAQQAIDYAYHKGVTWAVLSDFEGLKVLNAEVKEINPYQATFQEFDVDMYVTRFDRLWWLSRPAMQQGVLDRQAEDNFKKSRRTPITEALFDNLKDWRGKLYKNLRGFNKDKLYSPAHIDEAVQRILDRLIFIRTAEDRDVEGEHLIALVRELRDRNRLNDLPAALNRRFRELDTLYNSNLFAPHFSEALEGGAPTVLADIIEGLYGSRANYISYNFALIDADILGRVYEQYLGYVLSERDELEAKRAKRKAQGIYYTPTFVVKYIVQQTLGKYLQENGYHPSHPVRVLDPACGSGSFLIEAFDVLDHFVAHQRSQTADAPDVLDRARQLEILTRNLYGVDKDEQAVEVARLNLLLKALHAREQLPKLQHIRHGDSLISGERAELEKYFGKDWEQKHPFDWHTAFPEVFEDGADDGFDVIIGNPPYVRIQTLAEDEVVYFGDKYETATSNYDIYILFVERALQLLRPGGIIGFILPKKFFSTQYGLGLRNLLSRKEFLSKIVDFGDAQVFDGVTTYTCLLFLQKVAQNNFTYIDAEGWLKSRTDVQATLPFDLPETKMPTTDFGAKSWSFSSHGLESLFAKINSGNQPLGETTKLFVGLQTSADQVYIVEERTGSTADFVSGYSRATNKTYRLERGITVPLLKGSLDIRRYYLERITRYVVFPYRDGKLIPAANLEHEFPQVWKYLNDNRGVLSAILGKGAKKDWYSYAYPKNLTLFSKPKLLTPSIAKRASFALDEGGDYYFVGSGGGGGGGYGVISQLPSHSPKYLLALLNSSLLDCYLQSYSSPFHHGYFAYNKQYIERLPIRRINFDDPADKAQHDAIVALVTEMLDLQKQYAHAAREILDQRFTLETRIKRLDDEIDRRVFELYDLTPDEIEIVKGTDK